jgi:hypothetical protein
MAALFVSGCATNTGILPTGPGTYSVSVEREAMLGGRSAARRIAFIQAGDFCRTKSLQLKVLAASSFHSGIVQDTGVDIGFTCVPLSSSESHALVRGYTGGLWEICASAGSSGRGPSGSASGGQEGDRAVGL